MKATGFLRSAAAAASVALLAAAAVQAAAPNADFAPDPESAKRQYFTDTPLVDQDGREVRFYSDVLRDKVVLITFMYTDCNGVCPMHSAKLARVQEELSDHMGRDVRFVSITSDPERDTPQILKRFGERFHAGQGWTFLTGAKANIEHVTRKLGQFNQEVEAHSPIFILGNVKTGDWLKLRPDASSEVLTRELRRLLSGDAAES